MIRVLFVCLGNHCRSTMAEAVMCQKLREAGLGDEVMADSAGTSGYHIGEPPHQGTAKKLREKGIPFDWITGRRMTRGDLELFDYIVGMDAENLRGIRAVGPAEEKKLRLFSSFVPDAAWTEVPDPWYTGDYDETYRLIDEGCEALLAQLHRVLSAT